MKAQKLITIAEAIKTRRLLADGATGTLLEQLMGEASSDRNDLLAIENPELIEQVHKAYLDAGADIIKTATFNASALGLKRFSDKTNAYDLTILVNKTAASLARALADRAEAISGKQRWVAGSIGPGTEAPSLGGLSYAELRASYIPQCIGLIEGGADIALIETVQDSLQCKAAIAALKEAERQCKKALPFIASATLDAQGRLLSGADAIAFATIIEAFDPIAIGLNCSGGPDELEAAFKSLSGISSLPLSIMPNAGLPHSVGNKVIWPLDANVYAQKTALLATKYDASIVGGCCGTGPEHIAKLAEMIKDSAGPKPRPKRLFALASSFARTNAGDGFFVIDERSNAAGSAAFKALIKAGDLDGAAQFVISRAKKENSAKSGAKGGALDISVAVAKAGAEYNEAAFLSAIVNKVSPVVEAAISIDTSDYTALEASLPHIAGRPLINSVNLEDIKKAEKSFELAKEFGAAVVCLALDKDGPALTASKKLKLCKELYELAIQKGLKAEDLLFDTCTFPLATGDVSLAFSAVENFNAIAQLKEVCPGSISVLGVGNSSFGLPKALRPYFTACFLELARANGLGAAIADPYVLSVNIPEPLKEAMEELISARNGAEGYGAAIEKVLDLSAVSLQGLKPGDAEEASENVLNEKDPTKRLFNAIINADSRTAEKEAIACAEAYGQTKAAGKIADAMTELGRRYDSGLLALPLVLRSSDVARAAFSAIRAKNKKTEPGRKIVLSTVKGDLHDIGKNLVAMVFEAAGYEVLDLGTDKSHEDIVKASLGAVAVGVSGLLTRSLAEMARLAELLAEQNSASFLLCGGAAVDKSFVQENIEPLRPSLAAYAKDPFEALSILKSFSGQDKSAGVKQNYCKAERPQTRPDTAAPENKARANNSKAGLSNRAFNPPFIGSDSLADIGLDSLLKKLNGKAIYRSRWKYKNDEEGKAALEELIAHAKDFGSLAASSRYGFFNTKKTGNSIRFFDGSKPGYDFPFPATRSGRSVADFYADEDVAAAFCLSLGSRALSFLNRFKGNSSLYLRAHGLLAGLAEAAAEISHEQIINILGAKGSIAKGRRYSFGFPSCPGVEYNGPLLELLEADKIGLSVSAGHQLKPEFSVSAIIIPRAEAHYLP